MPIRIVLAEDQYFVREGIRRLLEAQGELEIAAVCDDLDSLLATVAAEEPDVVVTDVRMPPTNTDEGIRAAIRLRETNPGLGVVVLSQYASPSYVLELLEGGSDRRAYLLKERVSDVAQLVAAINAVAEGGSVMDPKVVEALVAESARSEASPLSQLTPRERDVLREMAEGKNNAAIAGVARLDRALRREGDPLDLPEARADVGACGAQAREGRGPLPGRERLNSSARGEPAHAAQPSGDASLVSRPPIASTRSRIRVSTSSGGACDGPQSSNVTTPSSPTTAIVAGPPSRSPWSASSEQK